MKTTGLQIKVELTFAHQLTQMKLLFKKLNNKY